MSDEYAQFMTEIITILNNCNDKQTATRIIRDKLRVSIEVQYIETFEEEYVPDIRKDCV